MLALPNFVIDASKARMRAHSTKQSLQFQFTKESTGMSHINSLRRCEVTGSTS